MHLGLLPLKSQKQQQQPKPPLVPFLKPLIVEPTGGSVYRPWDQIEAGRRSLKPPDFE